MMVKQTHRNIQRTASAAKAAHAQGAQFRGCTGDGRVPHILRNCAQASWLAAGRHHICEIRHWHALIVVHKIQQ